MHYTRPTSAWANRARSQRRAQRDRARILACLRSHGPQTRDAISQKTHISGDSLRPRVCELMRSRAVRVRDTLGITKLGNKAERLEAVQ